MSSDNGTLELVIFQGEENWNDTIPTYSSGGVQKGGEAVKVVKKPVTGWLIHQHSEVPQDYGGKRGWREKEVPRFQPRGTDRWELIAGVSFHRATHCCYPLLKLEASRR